LFTFTTLFGQWLSGTWELTQHAGLGSNINDFRKNSRSIKLGFLGRYLDWNMNYHIEHHMYAAVPFYNLNKLHTSIADQLPVPKSVCGAWKDMKDAERQRKSDPDYYIKVDAPTI